MSKINDAVKKLTLDAESYQGKSSYKKMIKFSEAVTNIITTDAIADAVLEDGKTLKGADAIVKEAARKDAGYIDDDDAHELVIKYFIPNYDPSSHVPITKPSVYKPVGIMELF
jgi:hypothetical protein